MKKIKTKFKFNFVKKVETVELVCDICENEYNHFDKFEDRRFLSVNILDISIFDTKTKFVFNHYEDKKNMLANDKHICNNCLSVLIGLDVDFINKNLHE